MVATPGRTLEWSVKITRADAAGSPLSGVFRYTSGATDATISSELYTAQPGFKVSSITCTLGFSVDTLEMNVLTTNDMVRADFLAGRWNAARVEFSQYDWKIPGSGFIRWPTYSISNVEPVQGGFILELRDLRQYLQQDYTLATSRTCPHRLGDANCGVSLVGSPSYSFGFVVTGVTSRSVFTCSGLTQATDYFSNGQVTFATGLHSGLPLLVRAHATGGVISLAVPLIADIVVAQTGTIIAGCLKRFTEDCQIKFNNVLNFGGFKDIPTTEHLVGGGI